MLERPQTKAAARRARYRQRRARGVMAITIEIGTDVVAIAMLCRLGWLNGAAVEHSRAEIQRAVENMLEDTAAKL
jgi:hypothetical protein